MKQEKHLYEYAVIRIVPQVEREEFINAGVILYCPSLQFLNTSYEINEDKIKVFSAELDLVEIKGRLQVFKKICEGSVEGGTIGCLPIASRFRWLTASRSTVIQTSKVHPGFCVNAMDELLKLFRTQVR